MANGFDLNGKVALVTGGNGGIGLGMAEGMAAAGADVVIWGSNPQKNATAEAKLRSYGRRVLAQRCDVADEAQVEACFAEALKQMGRVDACFANAGVSQKPTPFHELSTAEWRRVMSVNVDGVFRTLVTRGLIQEVGHEEGPGQAALYATTPAFLEQLGLHGLDQLPPIKDYLPEGVDLMDLQEQM